MTQSAPPEGPVAGPRSRAIFERDQTHMAPGLQSIALFSQLAMARGEGAVLFDEDGRRYVDFVAGVAVASIGAAHPHYIERMKAQLEKVIYGSFASENRARFLELLASVTPDTMKSIQLYSSGAESVEAAFRLAKSVTKGYEMIGFHGGFHGKTGGVIGLMGSDGKKELGPFMPGTAMSPYAYCYRCPLGTTYPGCGVACAEQLDDVIKFGTEGKLAAVIVEPMQGTAGNVIPPKEFLPAIAEITRRHGGVFIADEMITGFGRTGSWWGVDDSGTIPDVMTIGKGIGAGFPMSAILTRRELAEAEPFGKPSGSSSSFGGNPLAATAGLATLEVLVDQDLVTRSERLGARMLQKLEGLKEKYAFIGDVRGKGLMLAVEMVNDRETKEPLPKEVCRFIFDEALRRGLITMSYSPTIRINPPLVITDEEADEGIRILDEVFQEVIGQGRWRP